jgi:gamma-glutamyltranspeptidase/glutathione hydrolase
MKYDTAYYPYPSRRFVVHGRNGIVATSQYLAAQAGLGALKNGGNAIDAAVAAAACLTVVEPCSNGIGGDAFALVWTKGKLYGLNSSGAAPLSLSAEKLVSLGHKTMPQFGWEAVTVPGIPGAWAELSRRFGRLKLIDAMQNAILYAREGFAVSPVVAAGWNTAAEAYRSRLEAPLARHWYETFTRQGKAPKSGEIFRLPHHADTLEEIARTEAESFYRGELAARIASFARNTGGYITEADLAAFAPQWVEPLSVTYRGHEVWELPPNGHGLVALMALNILEGFDKFTPGDAEGLHRQIEAVKLAFTDGLEYIADPAFMRIGTDELLSPEYAAKRRALIRKNAITPAPGTFGDHGTVYLAAADGEGNMVSYIQSNYMGFGSGLVVPGTGIALHNRGANFSLDDNSPNCLSPGKKPYHTIIPGFLTREGKPVGPFGVMGGFMQPQGHVQVIVNMLDYELNPQAALDAPRWRWDEGLEILVEESFDGALMRQLLDRGHNVNRDATAPGAFGRGQIILRDKEGVLTAGTEPRADSAAAVW